MLPLDDPRWSSLRGTYTYGDTVAHLLRQLEKAPLAKEDWDDLFQECCHQYTSSEAGYAAIPHVVRLASSRPPDAALELLHLAAHTMSCARSNGSHDVPEFLKSTFESARSAGLEQVSRLATAQSWKPDGRYVLAVMATFMGMDEMYFLIEGVDTGIACPHCEGTFYPLESPLNRT